MGERYCVAVVLAAPQGRICAHFVHYEHLGHQPSPGAARWMLCRRTGGRSPRNWPIQSAGCWHPGSRPSAGWCDRTCSTCPIPSRRTTCWPVHLCVDCSPASVRTVASATTRLRNGPARSGASSRWSSSVCRPANHAPSPQRRHAVGWVTSPDRHAGAGLVAGRERRHAAHEGLIIGVCARLGLAAEPTSELMARQLVEWQWPDGGWNCDPRPAARHSSFHESIWPAWGLSEYVRATGDGDSRRAALRTAELVLSRRVFRSRRTGDVVHPSWVSLHYRPIGTTTCRQRYWSSAGWACSVTRAARTHWWRRHRHRSRRLGPGWAQRDDHAERVAGAPGGRPVRPTTPELTSLPAPGANAWQSARPRHRTRGLR